MMSIDELFPEAAALDPSAPEPDRAKWLDIPAKGAVYLLADRDPAGIERPLLLATVGDLRAALKRRLADVPPHTNSKRIEYGKIAARVHWRRVDSSFAAAVGYAKAARHLFPDTADSLIPWRTTWWIAVERDTPDATPFPRFRKTSVLDDPALACVGPLRDKHAAARLIESLEDLFDLCRYHNILVQAPHAKACAYKEMGKCPAPCDGTVSLAHYRAQINSALAFAARDTRESWRKDLESQMKSAAAKLDFESANRLKQRLTRAGLLDNEAFNYLAPIEQFSYLTLQPGETKTWLEPWIIHGGHIESFPQFQRRDLPAALDPIIGRCQEIVSAPITLPLDKSTTEQIAIAAHHLFKGQRDDGLWLPTRESTPEKIVAATELLYAKSTPKPFIEQSTEQPEATIIDPAAP